MVNVKTINKGDKVFLEDLQELTVCNIDYQSGGVRIWCNNGQWYSNDELFYTKDKAIEYNLSEALTYGLLDIRNCIDKIIQKREDELLGDK